MLNTKKIILFTALTLIIAAFIFLLIPYWVINKSWAWGDGQNTSAISDTIGGITGAIVGFIGVILTFLAFYIQYQANQVQINALNEQKKSAEQQEKQILLQQFENNFFELLKLHRENVSELNYRDNEGRNVIIKIANEFFEILQALTDTHIIADNQLDEQDLANIAYTILFFGTDETVADVLENRFFNKYSSIKDKLQSFIQDLRKKENPYSFDNHYFIGHQSRLGHYFRHLRRIVTFVHRNSFLTAKQKRGYMRILRAQLSNHEQIILFFYSISDLGLKWELKNDKNEKLITSYHLLRNIPLGSIYGFRPKRYYPTLKMDNDFEVRL
jgi:hypothetical protein